MRAVIAAVAALFFLCGCSSGQDQAKLPTEHIAVDAKKGMAPFDVEVAATDATREKGLMFRTKLAPDAGMLFDFHKVDYRTFWMKNTPLPLDIIFIKSDGTISTIAENTVPYSEDLVPSSEPVRAVLEINGGRARALGIAPGAKVHAKMFNNAP